MKVCCKNALFTVSNNSTHLLQQQFSMQSVLGGHMLLWDPTSGILSGNHCQQNGLQNAPVFLPPCVLYFVQGILSLHDSQSTAEQSEPIIKLGQCNERRHGRLMALRKSSARIMHAA